MTEDLFTGRLLVASPTLGDPNFERTVILVLDHGEDGCLGVVLNRPSGVEVRDILPPWADLIATPDVVFQGGPVALDSALGVAVVPDGGEPLGWRQVHGRLGLVDLDAPPEILASELKGLRIFAGYAGWSAGQLEGEMRQGSWYLVDAQPADALTAAPDVLWRTVLRRQGGDMALVSTFPDDPAMN